MIDKNGVKKVALELQKGSTMLAFSCPICGFPALKNNKTGITFCAACEREIKFAADKDKEKTEIDKIKNDQKIPSVYQRLYDVCVLKIEKLLPILTNSEDNKEIMEILGMIEHFLTIIKQIEDDFHNK